MSQMEVGCPGARGAGSPPTQTQVGRTPHKPALPTTQPRAPPATTARTRHTETRSSVENKSKT